MIAAALIFVGIASAFSKAPAGSALKSSLRHECFMVRDWDSGKIVVQEGGAFCAERLPPCSTFKVPLAIMAFDAGVLKDEHTTFKWNGKKELVPAWEKDHDARTWLRDSVVWYSQRITPKLGLATIQRYLANFRYGNQDFSGGIETAWLSSSLEISPREQLAFLARIKTRDLAVKASAIEQTLSILPVEVDEASFRVAGKSGAGPLPNEKRIGWYIGYVDAGKKHFEFAAVFTDAAPGGEYLTSGREAKAWAVQKLREVVK